MRFYFREQHLKSFTQSQSAKWMTYFQHRAHGKGVTTKDTKYTLAETTTKAPETQRLTHFLSDTMMVVGWSMVAEGEKWRRRLQTDQNQYANRYCQFLFRRFIRNRHTKKCFIKEMVISSLAVVRVLRMGMEFIPILVLMCMS